MIRIIQRRLIIPRGDTGTITLPLLPGTEQGDVAVFYIYDPLTREVIKSMSQIVEGDELNFNFTRADTSEIEPSRRYQWDVKIFHEPSSYNENGIPIDGESINSYYAAFNLPICEVREFI